MTVGLFSFIVVLVVHDVVQVILISNVNYCRECLNCVYSADSD